MKTITILSVAIATSLATHLVLAQPADQATSVSSTTTSAQDNAPVQGQGHHAGKHQPKKDAVAKQQAKVTKQQAQVAKQQAKATKQQAQADQILAKFDTNHDGKITQDDLTAAHAEKILAQFDINHDGKITQDEVQALRTDEFKQMDTNGDGFLSMEEFQNGMRQYRHDLQGLPPVAPPVGTTDNTQVPPIGPMGQHGHHSDKGQRPGSPKGEKGGHLQAHFNRLDTNGDGQISETELVANLPVFGKFDCNETGVITKEDLLKGPCQKAQPTTQPATTTTAPVTTTTTAPAVTTTPTTTTPATTPSTTVEETTTETTVAQPTTQSDHSGGAPCNTCHSN
jgi:Ca2+-binding EF-hand superfamily protein